jgi:hypothetical protein
LQLSEQESFLFLARNLHLPNIHKNSGTTITSKRKM